MKGSFVLILLCLAFLMTIGLENLPAQTVPVTVKVTESDLVTGIAGVVVSYGSSSNYSSAYFPGSPTAADGTIGPVNLAPGTYSFQARYHNGNAVHLNVNVSAPGPVTVSFNTETVILELKSCTSGAYLDGGHGRYGSGTNYGTTHWPEGGGVNTGAGSNPPGQTIGQLFPGTYSFEMGYNGTAQVISSVTIPVGGTTITWQTTNVTLNYSDQISYGGTTGDSRFFIKPSMELLSGTYKFNFRPDNRIDLTFSGCDFEYTFGETGTISGTVYFDGNGLGGVTVNLLDADEMPVAGVDPIVTDNLGQYTFNDIDAGSYSINIEEPLGYSVIDNPISTDLASGGTNIVDFTLEQAVIANSAKCAFYWLCQLRKYTWGWGFARESEANLLNYISEVQAHYTPHFPIFQDKTTLQDWYGVLKIWGNFTVYERARRQLAALVLNMVAGKVGQYTVVTHDGRTAGEVLTYVSMLLTDTDPNNDHLAIVLARKVNLRRMIGAGIIPQSNILYKGNDGLSYFEWGFNIADKYQLQQNFPNPFNPTTTIVFSVKERELTTLKVYNLLGQTVATLFNGTTEPAQFYEVTFDGSNLASGMYIYRLQSGENVSAKMMILTK